MDKEGWVICVFMGVVTTFLLALIGARLVTDRDQGASLRKCFETQRPTLECAVSVRGLKP